VPSFSAAPKRRLSCGPVGHRFEFPVLRDAIQIRDARALHREGLLRRTGARRIQYVACPAVIPAQPDARSGLVDQQ
jgi:hypothetical protein